MQSEFIAFRSVIDTVHTADGTREIRQIFDENLYDFPKPSKLIRLLVEQATSGDALVLDFFAGSGTTAHAMMAQNAHDGGDRKFILVQLPEPTGREDYPTISAITRERVRRAGKAILREQPELGSTPPDVGFRSYRLSSSNFVVWDNSNDEDRDLAEQLSLAADNVIPGRSDEDLLAELVLKSGYPITTPIEKLDLAGKTVYSVTTDEKGTLFVCLDRDLTVEAIEAMAERDPERIIVLDAGFQGRDELKVNAMETVRSRNRNAGTDIVLHVV